MPIFGGNPNAFPPWPPPQAGQFPGGNWLMQQWGRALQQTPWNVQPGVQQIPHQFPTNPYAGGTRAQPVADVIPFVKRGLLNDPYTEMHEPGAGGRGLLGSKWRDPRFIQQYEVQQGLPPGSIKPPSAQVREMPTSVDAAFKKAQAGHEAETARRIAERRAAKEGPTPAQMARPVKQTPEISAKLAAARAVRRAAGDKIVRMPSPNEVAVAKYQAARQGGAPAFGEWVTGKVGHPKWYTGNRSKALDAGGKQYLAPKEYDALKAAYKKLFGAEP